MKTIFTRNFPRFREAPTVTPPGGCVIQERHFQANPGGTTTVFKNLINKRQILGAGIAPLSLSWSHLHLPTIVVFTKMPAVIEREKSHHQEQKLLKHLLSKKDELQNKPESIIKEIEDFNDQIPKGEEKLITVGPSKGEYIREVIHRTKPTNIFEFGTYVGYSTLLLAVEVLKIINTHNDPEGFKIFTFEFDPIFYEINTQIIELSGLSKMIQLNYGKVSDLIENVVRVDGISKIDLLFIDHWKYHYLPDLRIVESVGLIRKHSVIVADNVLNPGVSDYLEYIKQTPSWKQQYNLRTPNTNHRYFIGKYGLIYETLIKEGYNCQGEVDGVAITTCVDSLT